MTKFFANFLRDESGASAAEYVILTGVMGALIAAGTYTFGTDLKTALGSSGQLAKDCATGATTCQ
ncbi:MAG: Flp family type IVb pilin [Novosphingobium sp.]